MSDPAPANTEQQTDPYIVCRVEGNQMHCALWTLEGGDRAIALFMTREAAESFFIGAGLADPWRVSDIRTRPAFATPSLTPTKRPPSSFSTWKRS
jgi:hypothetical protein